jgi:hypothetical protein
LGSEGDIGTWSHEYVRYKNKSTEICYMLISLLYMFSFCLVNLYYSWFNVLLVFGSCQSQKTCFHFVLHFVSTIMKSSLLLDGIMVGVVWLGNLI